MYICVCIAFKMSLTNVNKVNLLQQILCVERSVQYVMVNYLFEPELIDLCKRGF